MRWFAAMPSNIALIKYMGKEDNQLNVPTNPSLSYTLNHLKTQVELEAIAGHKDSWEPLATPGAAPFELSEKAQARFLNHLSRIKARFGYDGAFIVRSCNNFPHSSGLASSASSFAALTQGAALALSELTDTPMPALNILADWSREGSGSSCRSFFSPWALWNEEGVGPIDLPYTTLHHQAIIVSHSEKEVSSSLAHQRVKTSPLFKVRPTQAQHNLKTLLNAFYNQDWKSAYEVTWLEFHQMHQLFETAEMPFSYMTDASRQLLQLLQDHWHQEGDGPLITMDAGPNIHLLWREDATADAERFKQRYLVGQFDVI